MLKQKARAIALGVLLTDLALTAVSLPVTWALRQGVLRTSFPNLFPLPLHSLDEYLLLLLFILPTWGLLLSAAGFYRSHRTLPLGEEIWAAGKVAFGAMHGILPVALLTMGAIRAIPQVYLRSARTLHLSPWQTITTVLLPAALPEVFTGLRIGFTVTLLGVLLGEMFASKLGLGSMIMNDMSLAQSEDMVTVAIILFVFAAIANTLLLWIEHRLHRKV